MVGFLFRLVAIPPLSAVICPFDFEPLVTGVFFEYLRFLAMGLGVALFEDSILSLEPSLVLEVNRTTWRKISYMHLQTDG